VHLVGFAIETASTCYIYTSHLLMRVTQLAHLEVRHVRTSVQFREEHTLHRTVHLPAQHPPQTRSTHLNSSILPSARNSILQPPTVHTEIMHVVKNTCSKTYTARNVRLS
jgi:hypothetical protein